MFARHVTLGRAVIVIAGLLVMIGVLAQVFAGAENPWRDAALLGGAVLVFAALILGGRAVGGRLARRRGTDLHQGRTNGMLAVVILTGAGLALAWWLAG